MRIDKQQIQTDKSTDELPILNLTKPERPLINDRPRYQFPLVESNMSDSEMEEYKDEIFNQKQKDLNKILMKILKINHQLRKLNRMPIR